MHFCTDFRITLKCFCCHKNSHRTPLSAQEFWALLQTWTTHGFMPQTRAECLICRSATRWLYPSLWDWAGSSPDPPLEPLEAEPGQSQPFPAPWDALGPRGCTTSPLWALTVHVSLGKPWIVLLTSPIPYQTLPFYYPEDFWLQSFPGQELFFMLLHAQSCSVSQLSRREIIFYTIWTSIKFGFIF